MQTTVGFVIALGIAGCSSTEVPSAPPKAAADESRQAIRPPTPSTTPPTGVFASLPKADWPCARREITGTKPVKPSSDDPIARIHYTKAESCRIPIELVVEGVVGCVEQIERSRPIKVSYDGDRLVALEMYTAEWQGDSVHEAGHVLSQKGSGLDCQRRDGSKHWHLELDSGGRPLHEVSFGKTDPKDKTEITYSWQGGRLTSAEIVSGTEVMRNEMIYDCSALK